jgi:hypothetical protein
MERKRFATAMFTTMIFLAFNGHGQTVENITSVLKDGVATVTYDLIGFKAKETYLVNLYSSYNEFSFPLKMVSGDVGKDIKEGKGKKIEWKAVQEAPNYKGELTFRVQITLNFQPLEFINPTGGSIRRGQTTIIEWQGGYSENEKELELYQYDKKVASLGKMKGVWQYTWKISKDLLKGDGYTLKLVGKTESVLSGEFRIKPGTPLLLKLSPLFVTAAIIPFLGGSKTSEKALPNAPSPN